MFTQVVNSFIDPNAPALALKNLINGSQLYSTFLTIGMALIGMFVALELYRLWARGGSPGDLVMLAIKAMVLTYFLTPSGGEAPLESVVTSAYTYFAHLGTWIATSIGGQQYNQLWATLNQISAHVNIHGTGNIIQQIAAIGTTILAVFQVMLLWALFLFVFMIILAIYVFTVLASRMFLVVSILMAPLLLPFILWAPMGNFMSKWVSTTLHAFLLPVIGAVTLVVALNLGMVEPLQKWANCVTQTSAPAYTCIGQQAASVTTAIIGGLVAIFIMISSDRVVSSFLGAAEVTASGLIAARWAASAVSGGARTVTSALQGEGAQPNIVRRETTNLDTGVKRSEQIITHKLKQSEA